MAKLKMVKHCIASQLMFKAKIETIDIQRCNTTGPLYNIIIMFDTVVTQKRNLTHEK